jgi:hypothetical protein
MIWDRLFINARLATMRENMGAYGVIEDAALAISKGRIAFAGPMRDLPGQPKDLCRFAENVENRWITPGLIDCHTHLVFGGNRASEFEMRLQGKSYEDIARAGGGIMSTVRATMSSTDDELAESAIDRLRLLAAEGVTTVEIKSGYGLDADTEIRLLRAAHRAGREAQVSMVATFLGLHALPPGANRAAFVEEVAGSTLTRIARDRLATAVDAFCENIAFTPEETATFFEAATRAGLRVRLHADQLSDTGGAALAARFNALSADHLRVEVRVRTSEGDATAPIRGAGLLAAAVRDGNPVVFFEQKSLYSMKGEVPDGEHYEPLGKAKVLRRGRHCTIVALAAMVHKSMDAAEILQREHGIDATVIDLRCLVPLDTQTILAEVARTGHLITVEENPRLCGWGAEISSIVTEECFWDLDGPIIRITTPHLPLPSADALEDATIPSVARIVETVRTRLG